ncbi:hypothetical protein CY34DRAFT_11937 [Suillus luteus UH-Slu-Lm8-n1]|uniref:Unplaced genomic scaffold CY34scaffold_90, whole genome shotgun sequence n=1 Tax=Suillus luteus UH-Slu-Lm8-n1 TaxID=930992 RepID=A0A0D0B9S1_9AGAM|nr:hypothetical protein CY34DRAFT_11937 [Suillus luteus UH-Slu-Lm8-n1]
MAILNSFVNVEFFRVRATFMNVALTLVSLAPHYSFKAEDKSIMNCPLVIYLTQVTRSKQSRYSLLSRPLSQLDVRHRIRSTGFAHPSFTIPLRHHHPTRSAHYGCCMRSQIILRDTIPPVLLTMAAVCGLRSSFATPSRPFCSLWLLYTVPYCMPTHPSPVLLTMAAVHGPILPALLSFTIPPVLLTMAKLPNV